VKVLYVSHTGLVGGAERSLLGLFRALPNDVDPWLISPSGGLHARTARVGIRTTEIAELVGSLKLHPIHTSVALGTMTTASAVVLRHAWAWGADLIHANSIRAGMIAAPVATMLRRPLVTHVRDCLPPGSLTRVIQGSLARRSAAVIVISHHVARQFDTGGRAQRIAVVDNPFDLDGLDPDHTDRDAVRAQLEVPEETLLMTLVGQITPWKGQEEAIRALAVVRNTYPNANLLLVGEPKFTSSATRYDNRTYLRALHDLVRELRLEAAVHFLGEQERVPDILGASDVALLPSWDEPFGRAVVEAMAMGCPVIATAVGGPAEIVRDGLDGLLVPPRRPEVLARAIIGLLDSPDLRMAMGVAARQAALARFGHGRHGEEVATIYRDVLAERGYAAATAA
jgi:glycosyltransferase involved in cell wall biosynthesis